MATTSNVIKLKIHFELNTPNGLRRVIFGLEKDATSGTTVIWTINFQLFERAKKTDPYGDAIVTLDVEVDKALNSKAEKAAKGLTADKARTRLDQQPTTPRPRRKARSTGRGAANGSEHAEEEVELFSHKEAQKHKKDSAYFVCASLWLFFLRQSHATMKTRFTLRLCLLVRVVFLLACGVVVCLAQTQQAVEKTELGNLQNYYATQDPHYANVVAQLPNLQAALNDLKSAQRGQSCVPQIDTALRRTTNAIQSSDNLSTEPSAPLSPYPTKTMKTGSPKFWSV